MLPFLGPLLIQVRPESGIQEVSWQSSFSCGSIPDAYTWLVRLQTPIVDCKSLQHHQFMMDSHEKNTTCFSIRRSSPVLQHDRLTFRFLSRVQKDFSLAAFICRLYSNLPSSCRCKMSGVQRPVYFLNCTGCSHLLLPSGGAPVAVEAPQDQAGAAPPAPAGARPTKMMRLCPPVQGAQQTIPTACGKGRIRIARMVF